MQLPFAFALALASTSIPFTFAAPSHSTISKMAPAQWTIVDMARTCDHGICHWSFAVNTTAPGPDADVTHCAFDVHGHPAWQTDSYGQVCGRFTVGAGWSGQFGPGKGFTTLSVVDEEARRIAYPAYTDQQLFANGTVHPDQAYTAQELP